MTRRRPAAWAAGILGTVALAGGAVVAALGGGGAPPPTPPGGTANLWVSIDGDPDPCIRVARAAPYDSAKSCTSFDAALDAASGGDTVRIKDGEYGSQALSGAKTSTVTFIGESVAGVVVNGSVVLVSNIELRNVTATSDDHAFGPFAVNGTTNVTLRNVKGEGDYVAQVVHAVTGFSWIGGRLGDFDGSIELRHCSGSATPDSEPFWIGDSSDGVLIEGLTFSDARPSENGQNGCAGDNFHLEMVRVDGASNDVTIRRNTFLDNGSNSAIIFTSEHEGGQPTDLSVVGNVFGAAPQPPILVGGACADYVFAYNTIRSGTFGTWTCSTYAGVRFVGNLGPRPASDTPACDAMTWTANVTQDTSDSSCGGTWVTGSAFTSESLGLTGDGHLTAGSAAIDAGETPGPNDVCTDESIMGRSGDIDGDPRPDGSACDAGADERVG